jgi:hypothetical protein
MTSFIEFNNDHRGVDLVSDYSLYARENNSRFHDDLDDDRSDQQSRLVRRPNCCHAPQRTSKDRLARISLRRQMHAILALFLFTRQ